MTDDQLRPEAPRTDQDPVASNAPAVGRNPVAGDSAVAGQGVPSGPDAVAGPDGFADQDGRTSSGAQAEQGSAARAALCRLADGENERSALGDLALADVLLPDLGNDVTDLSEADSDVLQLPVAQRQDGTQFVPTFTSEQRLAAALPEVDRYRTVQIATLGRIWPSDELLLAVDPGSEAGIALPAEGLRALAAMSG
ncbi:SseB family protein [Frankia sp. R82]|uniref:SseB family protein n=1 Tax=Frankia sp. R82 TaxID=2950553 RepID=UPI002043C892|nr:SseB family protein [Frankia sp. R82]MCM3886895.1 SseB family protein [Frankia sp. R82]